MKETSFGKTDFVTYVKSYMKKVKEFEFMVQDICTPI